MPLAMEAQILATVPKQESPQTRFLRQRSDLVGNESVGLTEFLFQFEGAFVINCFYLPVIRHLYCVP